LHVHTHKAFPQDLYRYLWVYNKLKQRICIGMIIYN
jgi:hypothetical protein